MDGCDVRTHFIGVIGHIRNRHVRNLRCFCGIAAEGLDKTCRKARDGFHIFVGGHTGGLEGIFSILLNRLRRFTKECINAADQLFVVRIGGYDFFAKFDGCGSGGNSHRAHCHTDAFEDAAQLLELSAGFFGAVASVLQFLAKVVGFFR